MIQIEYKCTKKDFVRIFASWSHRSIEGNFPGYGFGGVINQ